MNNKAIKPFAPWALLIAILLIWQLICSVFSVSDFIFPSPYAIIESLIEYAGPIGAHAWRTYWVTMAGFGIAVAVGLALGFMIGSSPTLYAAANEGIGYLLVSAGSSMKMPGLCRVNGDRRDGNGDV